MTADYFQSVRRYQSLVRVVFLERDVTYGNTTTIFCLIEDYIVFLFEIIQMEFKL